MSSKAPEGFRSFEPIVNKCRVICAYYPEQGSGQRRFILKVYCGSTVIHEEEIPWAPTSIHGPDVEDFLKLEQATSRAMELEDCKCS